MSSRPCIFNDEMLRGHRAVGGSESSTLTICLLSQQPGWPESLDNLKLGPTAVAEGQTHHLYFVHIYVFLYIYLSVSLFTHLCNYICIYIYMYLCICLYIYLWQLFQINMNYSREYNLKPIEHFSLPVSPPSPAKFRKTAETIQLQTKSRETSFPRLKNKMKIKW